MRTLLVTMVLNSETVGRLVGSGGVALLIVALLVKIATLLKRPTAHKVSVISLLVLLAGMALSAATAIVTIWAGPLSPLWAALVGILFIVTTLGATIVGIVGLATYDSRRFTQGRTQAVWALVISVPLLLLVIAGAFSAMGNAMGRTAGGSPVTETVAETANCAMTREKGWTVSDHASINPAACMMFRSVRPEAYAMILGEAVSGDLTLDAYADLVKENVKAVCSSVQSERIVPAEINGEKFLRRTFEARLKASPGQAIYYDQWLTVRASGAYQVVFWCPLRNRETVQPAFDRMLRSFRTIDPSRKIGRDRFANVKRPAWGYQTNLDPARWQACDELGPAMADSGADRSLEAVRVMPVVLTGEPVANEILAAGLLPRIGADLDDEGRWTTKPWESTWGAGLEITGDMTVDGTDFSYLLRVVRRERIAFLLAGWSHSKRGDPALVRKALDQITPLPSPAELPSPGEKLRREMSFVHNDIGFGLFKQDRYREAAAWFSTAHGFAPDDATILGNAANAMQLGGEVDRGLALLRAKPAMVGKSADLLHYHAALLADKGEPELANKEFLKAIDRGFNDSAAVLAWLRKLNESGHFGESEAAAAAWVAKRPGLDSRLWHAQTVSASGDAKRAADLFEAVAKDFPGNRRALTALAGALNDCGAHARAGEIAGQLLDSGKPTAEILMVLGWSEMGRKWFREAKTTFEKAAKLNPDDPEILNALRRASAQLGQGMDIDIKTEIQPVPVPESVAQALAEFTPAGDYAKDRPHAYLLFSVGYAVEKGKPLRCTRRYRIRVNTPEGVNNFSSIERTFDPLGERIFLNSLAVIGSDGEKSVISATDAYVVDAREGGASHQKAFHFQVPELKPGSIIEYTLTTEDLAPDDGFPFERHLFGETAAKVVFVVGDTARIKPEATKLESCRTIHKDHMSAWLGFHLPMAANEPMGLPYEDVLGCLTLGPAGTTWRNVGSAYLKDIAHRLKPEPEVAALARNLVGNTSTERERIALLARHVQRSISYTAIEFGVRARIPNAASVTLKNQYGDCKDQALLLHQLLQAAGIESHLALVNTSWRVRPAQPSLDQFDHMVLHIPSLGAGRLLDPTDPHLNLTAWQADGLWHSHALVLEPGKERLIEPRPLAEAAHPTLDIRREIQPSGDGWKVTECITVRGYFASWLRRNFSGLDADAQLKRAQTIMGRTPGVRVSGFTFGGLDDPAKAARLETTYEVAGAVRVEGDLMRAELPAVWETDYLATDFVKRRTTPFVVRHPLEIRSEVRISGIPRPTADSLDALDQSGGKRFANWTMNVQPGDQQTVIRFTFNAKAGYFKVEDYHDWHDEWQAAGSAWDRPLHWPKP